MRRAPIQAEFVDIGIAARVRPGAIAKDAGRVALGSVVAGVALCQEHLADALVTAPISKEALRLAGSKHPGHTTLLEELTVAGPATMMLTAPGMRVALATAHVPIARVSRLLSRAAITARLRLLSSSLRIDYGIARPRIAVLALNPHAGESGMLGREEIDVIRPAIAAAKTRGVRADGPFPADSFFARWMPDAYDAVLAMYHDQGLIAVKMTARGSGVNVTLGLPIVRTSPDHGTGFDIAGKNRADSSSMGEAIRAAIDIARRRRARRRHA
jgi:4-hydroxythreonine-4-phosphate dehydrogenase